MSTQAKTNGRLKTAILGIVALGILGAMISSVQDHAHTNSGSRGAAAGGNIDSAGQTAQLAALRTEWTQLNGQANQCAAVINQATIEARNEAIRYSLGNSPGAMPNLATEVPCQSEMAAITARMAVLERDIYRLQTGADLPANQFSGTPAANVSPSTDSSYNSAMATNSDRAEAAVDRYDRNGMREESNYRDSNGTVYALPTQPNYYYNPQSGVAVGTDSPTPPQDGNHYERLENTDQH
jgi:hypothetical protein